MGGLSNTNEIDTQQNVIDTMRVIQEALKSPKLLDERDDAIKKIKEYHDIRKSHDGNVAAFREEVQREKFADSKRKTGLDEQASQLKTLSDSLNRKNQDLNAKEEEITKRDRTSQKRESDVAIKETANANKEAALIQRELKLNDRESALDIRENSISQRENKLKDALK